MSDERYAPLHPKNCALGELRQNSAFKRFVECLNVQLEVYRSEYETEPASEFNRGKVHAIKDLLNSLAEQNLK